VCVWSEGLGCVWGCGGVWGLVCAGGMGYVCVGVWGLGVCVWGGGMFRAWKKLKIP